MRKVKAERRDEVRLLKLRRSQCRRTEMRSPWLFLVWRSLRWFSTAVSESTQIFLAYFELYIHWCVHHKNTVNFISYYSRVDICARLYEK